LTDNKKKIATVLSNPVLGLHCHPEGEEKAQHIVAVAVMSMW